MRAGSSFDRRASQFLDSDSPESYGASKKGGVFRQIDGFNLLPMENDDKLREIEEFFYGKIPITRAMGIRVAEYDGSQLKLIAPVALNHNHLGTAFGGSLSAIATLAGYGLLWLGLDDKDCHVVIRKSWLSFSRPVRTEIVAIGRRPGQDDWHAFKAAFSQRHKARINLGVTIEEDGLVAVEFSGIFVALR